MSIRVACPMHCHPSLHTVSLSVNSKIYTLNEIFQIGLSCIVFKKVEPNFHRVEGAYKIIIKNRTCNTLHSSCIVHVKVYKASN